MLHAQVSGNSALGIRRKDIKDIELHTALGLLPRWKSTEMTPLQPGQPWFASCDRLLRGDIKTTCTHLITLAPPCRAIALRGTRQTEGFISSINSAGEWAVALWLLNTNWQCFLHGVHLWQLETNRVGTLMQLKLTKA